MIPVGSVAYVVGRGSMWRLGSNGKYRHLWNQVIESLGLEDKAQEDKLLDDSTIAPLAQLTGVECIGSGEKPEW